LVDVLQTTFDVEHNGITYTFRIPSIKYRMEIGARAAEVRSKAYPAGQMSERIGIVDWSAVNFSRWCAMFELYLVRCTHSWPYGSENVSAIDLSKPPAVDFEKFPPEREDDVEAVGTAFEEQRARFRSGRDTDGRPSGAEAVDSGGNPGAS